MSLKFTKIRSVKSPVRAHATDAGIDFFIPDDLTVADIPAKTGEVLYNSWEGHNDNAFINDNTVHLELQDGKIRNIIIRSGGSLLIPLGVKVSIPKGHAMIFFNKSGVAAKKHLVVGSCVVDQDYQGELILNLNNIGSSTSTEYEAGAATIGAGDKIIQGILLPINYADVEEVDSVDELFPQESDRGAGGFGSSGR